MCVCAETNHETQEGVVVNSIMGNLTTVKRAADVYAKLKNIDVASVTAPALLAFMLTATGSIGDIPIHNYPRLVGVLVAQPGITTCNHTSLIGQTKVANLSEGSMNRSKSMLDSLHQPPFDVLVSHEGMTFEDLQAAYTKLTGDTMTEDEGNLTSSLA